MESRVIRIEIKFTRMTVAMWLGVLLLGGLLIAGRAVAQAPTKIVGSSEFIEGQGAVIMATDVVSSAISYQGVLEENNSPVTGERAMTFTLYSEATCDGPSSVASIVKPTVSVNDGLFMEKLNFDHDHFDGQALWLGIEVEGAEFDCQEILAAPYALSLRPGAVIRDSTTDAGLNRAWTVGFPPHQLQYKAAVYGRTTSGVALTYGVYGGSEGTGTGVYGVSGSGVGVYGSSSFGTAIYGAGDVRQSLNGNGLIKAAVYAYCAPSPTRHRFFNNVNDTAITVSGGAGSGSCVIDVGFDLGDRYWVVTALPAGATDDVFGSCTYDGTPDDELNCYVDDDTGTGTSRNIMVLIY